MSFLEKLKSIGIDLSKLRVIKITAIRFSSLVSIDRSIHIDGSTVIIDPNRLSGKQKRGLKQIIRTEVLEEAGALVDERNLPTVNEVRSLLPGIEEAATKFSPFVPAADMPLLKACLYLRKKYEAGESIEEEKAQITRVYGARGRNYANLCSAGYFEQWFEPLYKTLIEGHPNDPLTARSTFTAHYNLVVNELPWTEFVCSAVSALSVTAHVVGKMKRNIRNGVRSFNLHGLGEGNVKKILQILPDIQKQTAAVAVRIDKDKSRIFVRLEIPPQIQA